MIRFLSISMLIFFLLSCGAAKKQLSIETKPIDLITFKKNNYVTDEGKESLLRFQKDLIQSAIDEGVDPIRAQSMDPTIMLDFFLSETESTIKISVEGDTIWSLLWENGNMPRNHKRIDFAKNLIFYHDPNDRNKILNEYPLFDKARDSLYTIEEFRDDRKSILGYDCFKILVKEKEVKMDGFPLSFGDSIHELYVTDQINLPVQSIYNEDYTILNLFPLEILISEERMPGVYEWYLATGIK